MNGAEGTLFASSLPKSPTDEQWEEAARSLCEMRDEDPDERVSYNGNTCGSIFYCPRWENAKLELQALHEKFVALSAISDQQE